MKIGPQYLVPCALLEQILQQPLCEIKLGKWIIDVILWAFLIGTDMVDVLPGMIKEARWLPKAFFHYHSHKKVQKEAIVLAEQVKRRWLLWPSDGQETWVARMFFLDFF